jgi:PhzF family phenazine biosynthesis protein
MDVLRYASFSVGQTGGNPAGVVLCDSLPTADAMQACAAEVGYSETAFAMPEKEGWRVRYFSPESEVAFCGHATIALGAALAQYHGEGQYPLYLNEADISVEGARAGDLFEAALYSPATWSKPASEELVQSFLDLFGYSHDQLDTDLPPAYIHGGANHLVLTLKTRDDLARMTYELAEGTTLMNAHELVTVMLVHRRSDREFDVRNAFASGGVLEDPATGAAAAAFSGYLRDLGQVTEGTLSLRQGEDMGAPSDITALLTSEKGSPIRVSGTVRGKTDV